MAENLDPPKAVVFSIRFSVLLRKSSFVRIGRDVQFEEYRSKLFDPGRLDIHQSLFSAFTLPSLNRAILTAPDTRVGVFVLVSSELPRHPRRLLDEALKPYPWATVVEVTPDETMPHKQCVWDFVQALNVDHCHYAHCRLDDDDMISNDFVSQLSRYIAREFVGFGVSLSLGYYGMYDNAERRFSQMFMVNDPKVSAGLALIGSYERDLHRSPADMVNVHALGSHVHVDRRAPTILDSRAPAFIRSLHPAQDTSGSRSSKVGDAPEPEIVARLFAVDIGVLPTKSGSEAERDEMLRLERKRKRRARQERRRRRLESGTTPPRRRA
jgi:hypothetical protein